MSNTERDGILEVLAKALCSLHGHRPTFDGPTDYDKAYRVAKLFLAVIESVEKQLNDRIDEMDSRTPPPFSAFDTVVRAAPNLTPQSYLDRIDDVINTAPSATDMATTLQERHSQRAKRKARRVGIPARGTPYDDGVEAIRKDYRVHLRNRGGKWYLIVYWEPPNIHEGYITYQYVYKLVQSHWPKAYCTSCSTMGDATFRLNP